MSLLTGGTITGPSRGISSLTNRSVPSLTSLSHRSASVVAFAKREGGVSSRTRRSDNRGKKGLVTTTEEEKGPVPQQNEELEVGPWTHQKQRGFATVCHRELTYNRILWEISKEPMPELPGLEPDFFEGPQWNAFGFFMQYLWAFGVVFALIACGVAVATYNQGATDFRETPAYKESMQSKELLDDSNSSSSEVFEQNPTEVAPPLE